MKTVKLKSLILAALLASLAACGGTSSETPTVSAPTQQAHVAFVNVQGDPNKVSLLPGERNVEVAAFRMSWYDPNFRSGISQLVFTNQSTVDLWETFKDFTLVDDDGRNMSLEVSYYISRNEARNEIIVDFYQHAWRPNDYGVVPKTYSLLASLKPGVVNGTAFSFKLSAVQMHDAGKIATINVSGRNFTIARVAGVELPVITTTSTSYVAIDPSIISGAVVQKWSFSATCPTESQWGCQLSEATFYTVNVFAPRLSVNGVPLWTSPHGTDGGDFVSSSYNMGYYLSPGQTVQFDVSGTVYDVTSNLWITITDMAWVVGGQQLKVNPIIPTGEGACGYIISDGYGCRG